LAEYCQAIEDAGVRLDRLTQLVVEAAALWSMAPACGIPKRSTGCIAVTTDATEMTSYDIDQFRIIL